MLALRDITRRFGGVLALDEVSAAFLPGRVHGVLGENGAGKTTLMRVAAGLVTPDRGVIQIDGRELPGGSARAAARAGIAMVHQHFMLVPTLTVVENCLIGRRGQAQFISRRRAAREIAELGRRVGLEVDPFAVVETLSVGEQQRVEIVRALAEARRVLILDEPTAVLAPQETEQLFTAIDRLRGQGLAVVFISHKLGEVERICDELTILRRGRVVYAGAAGKLSQAEMAALMVGALAVEDVSTTQDLRGGGGEGGRGVFRVQGSGFREEGEMLGRRYGGMGGPALELLGVEAEDADSHRALHDVSLAVRAGEILGVAGVEGNGQDVLAGVIVGALRPVRGRVVLGGREVTAAGIRERAAAGLAHVAEDRLRQALVPAMNLAENLMLKAYRGPAFARAGFLRARAIREHAAGLMQRFDVRAASMGVAARQLSGGNQQKLVLARELAGDPRVIVAHNPVRGLDVAATRFVFEQLLEQRRRGAGILLIHSDLDELLRVSDRVAVLYGGRLTLTEWPKCDRASIGRMMLGARD